MFTVIIRKKIDGELKIVERHNSEGFDYVFKCAIKKTHYYDPEIKKWVAYHWVNGICPYEFSFFIDNHLLMGEELGSYLSAYNYEVKGGMTR